MCVCVCLNNFLDVEVRNQTKDFYMRWNAPGTMDKDLKNRNKISGEL